MDHEYYPHGIEPFLEEAAKVGYGPEFYKENKKNIAKI